MSRTVFRGAPNDEELARRVSRGDRKAFMTLYDRYASRVFGLLIHMFRESMTAEEVAQETFLKVWLKAGDYDTSRGSLLTWLLTIARNAGLDRLRFEARRPIISEPLDPEVGWGSVLADTAENSNEMRWRTIRFAVNDLPLEQRRVIELAYFQGLSHSEIANALGLPLGTVKTRIRLGMEKLRRAWLGEDPDPKHRSVLGQADVQESK